MFTKNTGLIIPTRNRPKNLFLTLNFFIKKKIKFFKIIIIDSSDIKYKKKIKDICKKFSVKLIFSKASTSIQRNIGLKELKYKKVKFIMFLDDDLRFYKDSFNAMNNFIKNNINDYIGFCFNHVGLKNNKILEKIKTSRFIERLGLYSKINGAILNSGWHTKIYNQKYNLKSQWLPTSASIFHKKFLHNKYFDESFGVYSYLEDLDFSLQLNPNRKNYFIVISNAKFIHAKDITRTSFYFGYYEFINRYKIVKKFNLSKFAFYRMAILKIVVTIISIFSNYKNIRKLVGNIFAIITCVVFNSKLK